MKYQTKSTFGALLLAICTLCVHAEPWEYENKTDKMSGKTSRLASLISSNSLNLDFPYKGNNPGGLVVREHPQQGLDVALMIEKGQLMCRTHDPCKIQIKFDDEPPITFNGSPPSDHSTTVAFLSSPKTFVSKAQKAKSILVRFTLYHNGTKTLEFNADSPLEWDKKPTVKAK